MAYRLAMTIIYFFCGIGQGGKYKIASTLTFIALYAAVDGGTFLKL